MHRSRLSAVLSLSVLLSTLVAAQDASYTFTTIDVPGAITTLASGINIEDQIVGQFSDGAGEHGFLKDGATFTPIDVPGAIYTLAFGINETGHVAGWFNDGGGRGLQGFLWDGDVFTPINVPGADQTRARGINDTGQIVGWFSGSAVGRHGFLTDGTTFTLVDVPGAVETEAFGINAAGQIVGTFDDTTKFRGFLKDGATFTVIDVPGSLLVVASGINAAGQIVGQFHDGTRTHGFLATPVVMDTTPPVITVAASPATLWPPTGQLVTVTVSGTITDESNGSGVQEGSAAYQVTDEYGQIRPSGSVTPGADSTYAFTVDLQASRRGNDQDGRQYLIAVSATDKAGNRGVASTIVTVPRN